MWTGTPLKPLLEEAGLADSALEVLFTGACVRFCTMAVKRRHPALSLTLSRLSLAGRDRGIQGGEWQYYQRSLSLNDVSARARLFAPALRRQAFVADCAL